MVYYKNTFSCCVHRMFPSEVYKCAENSVKPMWSYRWINLDKYGENRQDNEFIVI